MSSNICINEEILAEDFYVVIFSGLKQYLL